MSRFSRLFVVAALSVTTLLAGGVTATASTSTRWVDQPVTFSAGGMTIYGTYRHPTGPSRPRPAALLIAGSGPTDRDGNTRLIPGHVDTLRWLADTLSDKGVPSLRYDKLGTGQTGLGPFKNDVAGIGVAPYEQEADAALRFLAEQPGVNRHRLMAVGHSEGALWALLLANQKAHSATPIHALGLLEPLSRRYLDILDEQLTRSIRDQEQAGVITTERAETDLASLAAAIASLRASGTVPATIPTDLGAVFNPFTAKFLSEADRFDPARLAHTLRVPTPVLVSCSDADIPVRCTDVDHLVGGLRQPARDVDFPHLSGVDHVLKEDPSGAPAHYGDPLPFSGQLRGSLDRFIDRHLRG